MKITLAGLFAASLAFAQDKPNFEVKTISSEVVAELDRSDAAILKATEEFARAQEKLKAAQTERANAEAKARGFETNFEGGCSQGSAGGTANPVNAVYVLPQREYRRVEIKGRYLLISSGKESCSPLTVGWWASGISGATLTSGDGAITSK